VQLRLIDLVQTQNLVKKCEPSGKCLGKKPETASRSTETPEGSKGERNFYTQHHFRSTICNYHILVGRFLKQPSPNDQGSNRQTHKGYDLGSDSKSLPQSLVATFAA
jgi:hypothetical protein